MVLWRAFLALLMQEFLIIYKSRLDFFNPILFFVLVISLFPLTMSADSNLLVQLAPGIIWIAILFSAMLSFDNIFNSDFEDGGLEQLLLNPCPLPLLVVAKIFSQWLISCFPLILLSIPMSLILFLPYHSIFVLFLTLIIGTPAFYFIGSIASALTLGLKQKGFLVTLLIVPLYVPILIFAISAVSDSRFNLPIHTQLAFLGSILTLCLSFAPIAIASAIRISYE